MGILLNRVVPHARLREFLDVVDHAIQVPLRIDLVLPAVVQPSQTLVVADVGKHRLDGAKALAVQQSPAGGVDRLAHALTWVRVVFGPGLEPIDLTPASIGGLHGALEALAAEVAGLAVVGLGGVRLVAQAHG